MPHKNCILPWKKKLCQIVEAIKHWFPSLGKKKFKLINDQRPVAYMFDNFRRSKIKNIKVQNWRLELSSYRFDIVYRPGPLNYTADALTRNSKTNKKCGLINSMSLEEELRTVMMGYTSSSKRVILTICHHRDANSRPRP